MGERHQTLCKFLVFVLIKREVHHSDVHKESLSIRILTDHIDLKKSNYDISISRGPTIYLHIYLK